VILVDTSVIVAWLDEAHDAHVHCEQALVHWAGQDQLAVSAVTYAELAAGGRTREAIDEDLRIFQRIDLDFDAAWKAGLAFGRHYPGKSENKLVLPDFLISRRNFVVHTGRLRSFDFGEPLRRPLRREAVGHAARDCLQRGLQAGGAV
jgi:predicted nucleic acid-binding protein